MKRPITISFDIGNTLLKLNGSKGFCSYFCDKTGLSMSYLRPLFFEYFLVKHDTMECAVEEVCRIIDYKQPKEIIDGYVRPSVETYDDVIPTLRELKKMGISIITISNCTPWEANGLDETGLSPYIDKVYYSFLIGAAKPDLKIFRHVQNDIETQAESILHIGDSLEADVKGALAAGWASILLDRDYKDNYSIKEGCHVINRLSNIIEIVT